MKKLSLALFALIITTVVTAQTKGKYVLVIHGGAGTILKSQMTPEKEKLYKQGLQNALNAGNKILKNGGTALDAVEAAIMVLEDDSLFNAGKGAVFTNEGKNELDASIMDGKH
jgi:beta-aspartyl-peptidase (threonine type)